MRFAMLIQFEFGRKRFITLFTLEWQCRFFMAVHVQYEVGFVVKFHIAMVTDELEIVGMAL